jgi:transcriptional regulator with XRE-family HTH domain
MYRERLDEIRRERGFTKKRWAEESGVSIDAIDSILHPDNPDKCSPKVNTLEDLCRPLGVELWEIFYIGDKSLVALQSELTTLREERDKLFADNAVLLSDNGTLKQKVDDLKDELLDTHRHYNKLKTIKEAP